MGELHLDILVDRMRREFNVEANIGKPQVSYRERITKNCEIEGKFVRQSGGRGQFGHCWIRFAPADEGQEGLQFVNEVVGGVVPKEYIPAIQKGIEEQMKNGVVAGYPLIGLKATVLTVLTTTSTPTRWRSRWLLPWQPSNWPRRAVVSCLSQSWR